MSNIDLSHFQILSKLLSLQELKTTLSYEYSLSAGFLHAGTGSIIVWVIFCRHFQGEFIKLKIVFDGVTFIISMADHSHFFMHIMFPGIDGSIKRIQPRIMCELQKTGSSNTRVISMNSIGIYAYQIYILFEYVWNILQSLYNPNHGKQVQNSQISSVI